MLLTPRQEAILRCIRSGTGERVEDLCRRFGVSEATVRRDLLRLQSLGLIRRVRGGAMPSGQEVAIPAPAHREAERLEEKRRIAAAAAALVADNSVIILDAGTTTKQMVPHLAARRNLTVITRDLVIALQLSAYPHIQTICVGGTVQGSHAVAGALALRFLDQLYADQIFLGALGVTVQEGIWTANGEEAVIKLEAMRRSRQRVLLADSSKIGRSGGIRVAPAQEVHVLITDAGVAPDAAEAFARLGITVQTV